MITKIKKSMELLKKKTTKNEQLGKFHNVIIYLGIFIHIFSRKYS